MDLVMANFRASTEDPPVESEPPPEPAAEVLEVTETSEPPAPGTLLWMI